ncbi:hypothetical protein BsWGS_14728 [Bradybaena similaris]
MFICLLLQRNCSDHAGSTPAVQVYVFLPAQLLLFPANTVMAFSCQHNYGFFLPAVMRLVQLYKMNHHQVPYRLVSVIMLTTTSNISQHISIHVLTPFHAMIKGS